MGGGGIIWNFSLPWTGDFILGFLQIILQIQKRQIYNYTGARGLRARDICRGLVNNFKAVGRRLNSSCTLSISMHCTRMSVQLVQPMRDVELSIAQGIMQQQSLEGMSWLRGFRPGFSLPQQKRRMRMSNRSGEPRVQREPRGFLLRTSCLIF